MIFYFVIVLEILAVLLVVFQAYLEQKKNVAVSLLVRYRQAGTAGNV